MRLASERYRTAENSLLTKHVVAAGSLIRDAGSTPAASTNLRSPLASFVSANHASYIGGKSVAPKHLALSRKCEADTLHASLPHRLSYELLASHGRAARVRARLQQTNRRIEMSSPQELEGLKRPSSNALA